MPDPGFSASAYLAALTPPTFEYGDRVYIGVLVSHAEWMEAEAAIERAKPAGPRSPEERALLLRLTRLCFPHRWWQPWKPDVAALVATLPYAAQIEAVSSFTGAQMAAQLGPAIWAEIEKQKTHGTPSAA